MMNDQQCIKLFHICVVRLHNLNCSDVMAVCQMSVLTLPSVAS